jgi:glucans biosynthesis protein C
MHMETSRRYDLDWLRVIAIFLLMFYHTGMIFVANWGWHIKDENTSHLFAEWMFFMNRWRMVLLFFISGAGSWYALGSRTNGGYLKERSLRLLFPLIVGMLIIVPPQIYIERLWSGMEYAHYFEFYTSVFSFIPYPAGSFSWHHMWFIAYLFLYSIIALPVFSFFRSGKGYRIMSRISGILGSSSIYLPVVIITFGYMIILNYQVPTERNLVDDWARFFYYFCYFILGFVSQSHPDFWKWIEEKRRLSLQIAFVSLLIVNYYRWNALEPGNEVLWVSALSLFINMLVSYTWVLAILGYAKKYLNRPAKWLTWSNEAIYPFYILHQTVIVIIGYYFIQDIITDSIWAKFWIINVVTLFLCLGMYELFIRPYKYIRPLFGLKWKSAKVKSSNFLSS